MSAKLLSIQFTKMQGAGNDYIYVDATRQCPDIDLPELARAVSSPHFGVGADGMVVILRSDNADLSMRMFNADGSEAEMCGNASRCVALYARERGLVDSDIMTLETRSGIKILTIGRTDGKITGITVDMGLPQFGADCLPGKRDDGLVVILTAGDEAFTVIPVSMGNPHGVIFTSDLSDRVVLGKGPLLESNPRWPEKANIEFAHRTSDSDIDMRVWERGTGETLACGTGACAVAAAAWKRGAKAKTLNIHLKGGSLNVSRDSSSGHLLLTGPAEFICDGVFYHHLPERD